MVKTHFKVKGCFCFTIHVFHCLTGNQKQNSICWKDISLTLLHSEGPELHTIVAFLIVIGFKNLFLLLFASYITQTSISTKVLSTVVNSILLLR